MPSSILDHLKQLGVVAPGCTYLITFTNGDTRMGKIDVEGNTGGKFFVLLESTGAVAINSRHVRSIEETSSPDE